MRRAVKVSRRGRVTIPKDIRESLGIREGDFVEVRVEDGVVKIVRLGFPEPGEPVGVEEFEEIRRELEELRGKWR